MNGAKLFFWTGVSFVILGGLLMLTLPLAIAGCLAAITGLVGDNPYTFYMASTAGAALIGWGACLLWKISGPPELRTNLAMGTGIGLVALSVMRIFTAMSPTEAFDVLRGMMLAESFLFLGLALWFLQFGCGVFDRLHDAWGSLLSMKRWVVIWVFVFLAPVNLLSLILYPLTGHPVALWTALAFGFVLLTNLPLVLYERGISKATSIPHLIPWIPLVLYLAHWLSNPENRLESSSVVYGFAVAALVINGISVIFDLLESYRWFAGDRQVV